MISWLRCVSMGAGLIYVGYYAQRCVCYSGPVQFILDIVFSWLQRVKIITQRHGISPKRCWKGVQTHPIPQVPPAPSTLHVFDSNAQSPVMIYLKILVAYLENGCMSLYDHSTRTRRTIPSPIHLLLLVQGPSYIFGRLDMVLEKLSAPIYGTWPNSKSENLVHTI